MAISMPLLALLFVGTAEFSRGFYLHNKLDKAVRDSARYLSSNAYFAQTLLNDGTALDAARYIVKCGRPSNCASADALLELDKIYAGIVANSIDSDGNPNTDTVTISPAETITSPNDTRSVRGSLTCDDGNFGIDTSYQNRFIVVCAEMVFEPVVNLPPLLTQYTLTAKAVMRIVDGGPAS